MFPYYILQAMGCCNRVSNSQLVRPAVKIPFMAVCENHRKRLKLHQCCPGCGHFCTQVSILIEPHCMNMERSGSVVLDSRRRGHGFEPNRRHCIVVLEQDTYIQA